MEQLENIDIEETKKLFAYEMTEVLLMLQGEFATVSGKDMRHEQWAVDGNKLKLPIVHIPEVELENRPVSMPEAWPSVQITPPELPEPVSFDGLHAVSLPELKQPLLPQAAVIPEITPPKIRHLQIPDFQTKAPVQPEFSVFHAVLPQLPQPPEVKQCSIHLDRFSCTIPELTIPVYAPQAATSAKPVTSLLSIPSVPRVPLFPLPSTDPVARPLSQIPACLNTLRTIPPYSPAKLILNPVTVSIPELAVRKPASAQKTFSPAE